jgi:uncharacterized repeat protein (TIGR01451 family)
VSDSDPSHYIAIVSGIAIEKATNGEDADTPTGPTIEVGESVVWTYVVSNPGTVPLGNVTVIDDQGVLPVYVDGDTNNDDLHDPGETWTYEASGTAVAGQYANVATATGTDPLEVVVEATDPSHYLGYGVGIDIEKATNGEDADVAPGAQIAEGDPVTWTYVLTNTGDAPIADVTLVDDKGEVPVFLGGDTNGDTLLDPDEIWTFEAKGIASEGQYTNLATATGVDPEGGTVTDEDPSNYNGVPPGLPVTDIETGTLALVALLLLGAGAALIGLTRSRKKNQEST